MLAMDAAWFVAVRRLTKRRLWRVLSGVFLAAQMAALLSLMCELDWTPYTPKAVLTGVILWHFFGFGFSLSIILLLVSVRACKWLVRSLARIFQAYGWHGRPARPRRTTGPAEDHRQLTADDPRSVIRPPLPGLPIVAPTRPNSLTRREFLGACAALAPPLFTIGSTSVALAQLNNLRVRRFTLSIPTLPRALDGMTIAHVSDIHVGRVTSSRVLREMVNLTNSLRPDLVLMTGDLINYELADLSEGLALAKAMEGRSGLWMIEGNHDLLDDAGEFQRRVKAAGVPFLLDDSATATVRGHPVQLFGLSWFIGNPHERDRVTTLQLRQLLKQRQPDAFPILLAHHPHAFDAAADADLPLTLAGHTHGGQLMLDSHHGVGPAFFRYWSGLYQRNRSQMIVSNGVGNWFPIRINAPAEIVHLTLRCAESQG